MEHNDRASDIIKKLEGPIVIFGAGGFIGANLFREISSSRSDCYAVTHQSNVPWRLKGLDESRILHSDLKDRTSLERIFKEYRFKTIFNFASFGGYSKQKDENEIYATNFIGTVSLLETAAEYGISAYVNAGSSSEYGLNSASPKEDGELIPNSHYSVSKTAVSFLLKYYAAVKKLPVINLRFYSVYGPFEEPDRLVPKLVEAGMKKKLPPLVHPDISRDFIYVDDAVEAALRAAVTGIKKDPGGSVNIAAGKRTAIKEIVGLARDLFGIKEEPAWSSMENRGWDLKEWYGDPAKAKEILGWEARTDLRDGLKKTMEWTRNNQELLALSPAPQVSAQKKMISAVIACYKDGKAIPFMYQRLKDVFSKMGIDHEIIFVNDASPDDSFEVLSKISAQDPCVIAIEHSRNFGSQSAFLSGMHAASGDAVVLLDGDLQDPPEMIPDFCKKWEEGFDVVYGRRVDRDAPSLLKFFYKSFYRIFRGISYVPVPLDAGDFSLMDRKVVNALLSLPETDQFLRGLRAWVGYKQTGIDYKRPERMFGVTTNNLRKNIWWAKKAIFSFSFIPLELLSYLGVLITGISFAAIIWQVIVRIIMPGIPQGISTVIVLILFFGGIQLLAISVLGEYLMKIFEETKRRPKFIRKSLTHKGSTISDGHSIEEFISKRRK